MLKTEAEAVSAMQLAAQYGAKRGVRLQLKRKLAEACSYLRKISYLA